MNDIPISDVIQSLMNIQEHFEPAILHHENRTKDFAMLLGATIGMNTDELFCLMNGALIHDFGKIAIPLGVYNKPGKLSRAQRSIMQLHCQYGYDMLKPLKLPQPVMDIILFHHEAWNGSGYPSGIKGNKIPMLVRIMAIADVFDALISNRPYRRAMKPDSAIRVMNAGSLFDPELLKTFTTIMEKRNV